MSKPKPSPIYNLNTQAIWQRWEMDSLEIKPQHNRRASDKDPGGKAELLRLRAVAQAEAREQGLTNGYQAGYEQGLHEGRAQGLKAGLEEGREQGLAQGNEEGREIGLRSGHAEGVEKAREQGVQMEDLANAVAKALNTLEQEIGQALISLAVRIAEQVLSTTLDRQPEKILDLVGEIINIAPEHNGLLQLRFNPRDLELIQPFLAQDSSLQPYRLIADECITRGGCIAETTLGLIDATLETRWQRAIATLGHA